MFTLPESAAKVVGAKQTRRALNSGAVAKVFLARDADPRVTSPVEELAAELGVETVKVPTMKELGGACGIAVGAAVAAQLK